MDLITVLLLVAIPLIIFLWFRRSDPRLPPCPTPPLPIIGHLLTLKADPRPQFKQWQKECGDIFSLYMGRTLIVMFSGYDLLKETFVKRSDEFSDRPDWLLFDVATGYPGKGVLLSSGLEWKEQRGITMSILRSFGLGKNIMAQNIEEEASHYLKLLEQLKGEPTDLRTITDISTANIICSLLIGRRFEYDDEQLKSLLAKLFTFVAELDVISFKKYFPALRCLPGDILKIKKAQEAILDIIREIKTNFIQAKRQEMQDDENLNNFVAAYDAERNRKLQANEPTTMNDENLIRIIFDFLSAGTSTTATVLLWCILYMLNYPETQDKIYQEIVGEIGTERSPTIQDKTNMIYLNAFIMEVQRLASVSPQALPRTCPKDVDVRGFTIPKGTMIFPNFDTVFHDPAIWGEDVMAFRPERFIDEEGKLRNREEQIPFGMGRRSCPGEGSARTTLFIYLAAVIQRFQLVSPNPASPPTMESIYGLDVVPASFKVRLVDRKNTF